MLVAIEQQIDLPLLKGDMVCQSFDGDDAAHGGAFGWFDNAILGASQEQLLTEQGVDLADSAQGLPLFRQIVGPPPVDQRLLLVL